MPLEKMPHLITASAGFVFPTFYEGFGIPILEAMACEKLTFASNIPPIKEVAGDAVIYFDPANPENIASILAEGLRNRRELTQKLQPLWIQTTAKFSWHKCAEQTLPVLTKS